MALVLGTNSGFVTTAPTADPAAIYPAIDTRAFVSKDASPATAKRITEIGWWCDNATEEANFELGLYAADGISSPGEAGTLLHIERTNAKGTGAGWKTVAVDWAIDPSTDYWLGVQLDDTATATNINHNTAGGLGFDYLDRRTSLPDPFGGGAFFADYLVAIYAVWDAGVSANTTNFFQFMD